MEYYNSKLKEHSRTLRSNLTCAGNVKRSGQSAQNNRACVSRIVSITCPFFIQGRKYIASNHRAAQRIQALKRRIAFAFPEIGHNPCNGFSM